MRNEIISIRRGLEEAVEELGGVVIGAGTCLATGETDFSFDFGDKKYSIHLKEVL